MVQYRITGDVGTTIMLKDGNTVIMARYVFPPCSTIPARGARLIGRSTYTDAGLPFPAEGPHPMSVESTDVAGNFTQSEQLLVEIDTTPPLADGFMLVASSDTGPYDYITAIQQPAFYGRAEANARVRLFTGGVVVGSGIGGVRRVRHRLRLRRRRRLRPWEVTLEPLEDGVHVIRWTLRTWRAISPSRRKRRGSRSTALPRSVRRSTW